MLTTIKGYYENGQITLEEKPPVIEKTEVMITFLKSLPAVNQNWRTPGGLKGKVSLPDDFNEPIEDLKDYM